MSVGAKETSTSSIDVAQPGYLQALAALGGRAMDQFTNVFGTYADIRAGNTFTNHENKDQALLNNFPYLLGRVSLIDSLHLVGNKVPRKIELYKLVPLVPREYGSGRTTFNSTCYNCADVEGVAFNFIGTGGRPFLDTAVAIGLAYNGTLTAVAGAYITQENKLRIEQLQSVNAKSNNPDTEADGPKAKYKTGLHGGFRWRDTLVQAWMGIAYQLGVDTVEIQSAQNNGYSGQLEDNNHLGIAYDETAIRMGFSQVIETHNWQVPVINPASSRT